MLIKTKNGLFRLENASDSEISNAVFQFFQDEGVSPLSSARDSNKEMEKIIAKAKRYKESALKKGEDKNEIDKQLKKFVEEAKKRYEELQSDFGKTFSPINQKKEEKARSFAKSHAPSYDKGIDKKQKDEEKKAKDIFDNAIIDIEQQYASRKAEEKRNYERTLSEIQKKYDEKRNNDDAKKLEKAFLSEVNKRKTSYTLLFFEKFGSGSADFYKNFGSKIM